MDDSRRPPSPPGARPVAPPRAAPAPVDAASRTRELLQVAPRIEAPKGGGAIRGIGETFKANPVTGSASVTIPLPLPPGRAGRTPPLSLSYDSGAGNGIFGLGWTLSLPIVQRKTDKQLPRYRDAESSDTFVLSEVEDLVPVGATRTSGYFTIQRYQPRVEGAFALIERWSHPTAGIHWRTRDRANVLRKYGATSSAQIADPANSYKVFAWLLEEEWDELGNGVRYRYDVVSGTSPGSGLSEQTRSVAYRYLKRVQYGNVTPDTFNDGHYFEVVFDYGDHDAISPALSPSGSPVVRPDPFSRFKAGFDVRCHRLCHRVLVFHRFEDGQAASATLVKSLDLTYDESAVATTLTSAQLRGWAADGSSQTLPALELGYVAASQATAPTFLQGTEDLPHGIDFSRAQWVDLDGEGLSGLLTEAGGGWWYKRNEGAGRLGAWRQLPSRPGVALRDVQLGDVDGDGRLEVSVRGSWFAGTWTRTDDGGWERFRSFKRVPFANQDALNSRMIDVDGDGRADLVVASAIGLLVFRSDGLDGYKAPEVVARAARESDGPVLLFANAQESLLLADMTGDGLTDLVRVRHKSVCYWPNLGYGRFGRQVQMASAPLLDRPDRFDARRVRLADVDGAGPADLVYVGPDRVRWWSNQSGNGFGEEQEIGGVPGVADPLDITVADLLGDGTACLVWASPLLRDRHAPIRYVKLMAAGKPYLLSSLDNNLGRTTTFEYTPSTAFYLADRRAGTPWATRLPFPVQCLSRVTVADALTGWSNTTRTAYHHGFFDGTEREFRGFGKVEQWDTEATTDGDLAPVRTVTWFHTGAWRKEADLQAAYTAEYFQDGDAISAGTHAFEDTATWKGADWRQAYRALKGRMLRQEVYAEDGSADASTPYLVTENTWQVRRLQAADGDVAGVFLVSPLSTVTHHYERDTSDPRVTQELTVEVDDYGNVTRSASIAFPRRGSGHPAKQSTGVIVFSHVQVIHDVTPASERWHVGVPWRTTTWDLHRDGEDFSSALRARVVGATFRAATAVAWDGTAPGSGHWKRRVSDRITTYDDAGTEQTAGTMGARALVHQTYQLTYTSTQATTLLGLTGAPSDLAGAGYAELTTTPFSSLTDVTGWWARSGTPDRDAAHFYVPTTVTDPFGNDTTVAWHGSYLFPSSVTDALGNETAGTWDLRALQPSEVTDPNGDKTQLAYDALGRVTAMALVGNASEGDTLSSPTAEFDYDTSTVPASAWGRVRETHGVADTSTRWIETTSYSDGAGNVVMQKVTAAPDGSTLRWVGTGRVVLNNKGLPIKQYEPFYATSDSFEAEGGFSGVTPVISYDPLGRAIRVDLPDGNVRRVAFSPWEQSTWDENDNEVDGDHEDTPTTVRLDVQGRPFQTIERLSPTTELPTTLTLDIAGNPVVVTDPRDVDVQAQTFDMLGRPITTESPDGGDITALLDVAGQPLFLWKSGDLGIEIEVDALRRKVRTWEWDTDAETKVLRERFVYGEALLDIGTYDPADDHLRGRLVRVYDTAGFVELSYDFKGNVLSTTRRFFDDDEEDVDWQPFDPVAYPYAGDDKDTVAELHDGDGGSNPGAVSLLETEAFTVADTFDAMNRPVTRIAPDGAVTTYGYDDGGRLLDVDVDSDTLVEEIQYNPRGQRTSIECGNGVSTAYSYETNTFRLATLVTTRASDSTDLQALSYTYDPVGNIVSIADAVQDTAYFNNSVVAADQDFTYDALYRLTNAQGREKSARGRADWTEPTYGPVPDTSETMQRYEQRFIYDDGGNITEMRHLLGGTTDWVRTYTYPTTSNRLSTTTETAGTASYQHDARGNIVFWPHLYNDGASPDPSPNIVPDFRDQMKKALLNANDYAVYFYDHTGQRARKVVKKGANVEERRYVAGWEVWRKTVSGTLDEERTTLHVMDDQRRIAMIETKTVSGGSAVGTPVPRVRYQLDNHLGTAILELSDTAGIISYEEYHPYGTCAWWAGDSSIDVSRRRYRYTGMERDDETGLQYHSARYYAAWLGRWGSADPIGLASGANRYRYSGNRPIASSDTGGLQEEEQSDESSSASDVCSGECELEGAEVTGGMSQEEIEQVEAALASERVIVGDDYPDPSLPPPGPPAIRPNVPVVFTLGVDVPLFPTTGPYRHYNPRYPPPSVLDSLQLIIRRQMSSGESGASWKAAWELYDEYATGLGPEVRVFEGSDNYFVKEMRKSPGIERATTQFYEYNKGRSPGSLSTTQSFYRLSPSGPSNIGQAAEAHQTAIQSGVLMFVGGYYVVISEVYGQNELQIAVWNDTSLNSQWFHIPSSIRRDQRMQTPYGTTQQWFVWTVPLDPSRL